MNAVMIAAVPSAIAFALLCGYPLWGDRRYRQGREDGYYAAQHRQLDERWEDFGERAAQAGKHRAGQPRTAPPPPSMARTRGGDWYRELPPRQPRRMVTTADDLAPVILPEDGTQVPMRHQAAAHPERPTAAMPRLTDTGELRLIRKRGDEIQARIRALAAAPEQPS